LTWSFPAGSATLKVLTVVPGALVWPRPLPSGVTVHASRTRCGFAWAGNRQRRLPTGRFPALFTAQGGI
jgi:hypothetical protein